MDSMDGIAQTGRCCFVRRDPCWRMCGALKSIDHRLLDRYRNVRGKLYPGMRHEIPNEKEKYRVYGDVSGWKKEK